MSEALLVQPDIRFIRNLMASGGGDLKKCMQCGTCSVVCALAPADSPFPRKQILEAQWGLKDRLVGDPAVWVCHGCGDCTTYCPRGARPGDVFGAIRQQVIEHFSFPGFLGRVVQKPRFLAALLLLPSLILLALAVRAPGAEPARAPEFAAMFPIPTLETLFFAVAGLVLAGFGLGVTRFMKALKARDGGSVTASSLLAALRDIVVHERFSKCGKNKSRRVGHLLTFYGFMGLAIMGTAVGIGTMAGRMHTPLPLDSPWKVFANLSAAVLLAGCIILLVDRGSDPATRAASTYFDWFFLLTLAGVALTGVLSEGLRLAQADRVMYGVYFVHLTLVLALFLYAPYSKFAHFVYRTVAMAAAGGRQAAEPAQIEGVAAKN